MPDAQQRLHTRVKTVVAKQMCDGSGSVGLIPASTTVPAAAKQQNDKHDDEKRGGIHLSVPSLPLFESCLFPQPAILRLRQRLAARWVPAESR
jgi:hypothetical protein